MSYPSDSEINELINEMSRGAKCLDPDMQKEMNQEIGDGILSWNRAMQFLEHCIIMLQGTEYQPPKDMLVDFRYQQDGKKIEKFAKLCNGNSICRDFDYDKVIKHLKEGAKNRNDLAHTLYTVSDDNIIHIRIRDRTKHKGKQGKNRYEYRYDLRPIKIEELREKRKQIQDTFDVLFNEFYWRTEYGQKSLINRGK